MIIGVGKVFLVGVDLDEVCVGFVIDGVWERFFGVIVELFCLIIVVLNGIFVGGVMGMVLVCDMWVVVFYVKFFYLVMKFGFLF